MAIIDLSSSGLVRRGESLGSGLVRSFYINNIRVLQAPQNQYQIEQMTTQDVALYRSSLGTPVLMDLTFEADSYVDENGVTRSFDAVRLETVIVSISQAVNQVKTKIQGRKGTIKEYISLDDCELSINGILTGPNGHYPIEEVAALKNMLVAPVAKKVTSWYLQLWDVNQVVINDYSITPEEGGYSYQPFTINASSDEDVEFRVVPAINLAAIQDLIGLAI